MKNIIIFSILCLSILSCSKDDKSSASEDGLYRWSCKIDGQLYEWEGNLLQSGVSGQSTYSTSSLALQKTDANNFPTITITAIFPSATTGNFEFNSNNSSTSEAFQIVFSDGFQSQGIYSSGSGGTMSVNISSLSGNTLTQNFLNPGKVIGTFSGTIKSVSSNNTLTVTEGEFEAVRGS